MTDGNILLIAQAVPYTSLDLGRLFLHVKKSQGFSGFATASKWCSIGS